MPEKVLLKDILFNRGKVEQIAHEIGLVYPPFEKKKFIRDVVAEFPRLELKARISWISECLRKYLPEDFGRAVGILIKALPPPNDPELSDGDFGDFIYAPYAEYVAKNGCTREHLELSLRALREMTMRFSAEDAIRSFLNAFPKETFGALSVWASDPQYHVRRLCSEGTRPKLPWAKKIDIPLSASIPILDKLFSDQARFVTRSVANHVNDISKIEPGLALEILARWQRSGEQKEGEMQYILRHALRTLVKRGDPRAIQMLGFSPQAEIVVSQFLVPKEVQMNTALTFSFCLQTEDDTRVVVDYILFFQNKAGKRNSKKIFKLAELTLVRGKPTLLSKRHMLREHMTTRTLYRGEHEIELQVNGVRVARERFFLEK